MAKNWGNQLAEISNDRSTPPFDLDAYHGDHGASGERGTESDHVRTLSCRTVATGRFRQRHHIRDLRPTGSLSGEGPTTLLGEDEEPHPSEMLLAALGACLSAAMQANAVARGIALRKLEVHSKGEIDPSTLWGMGDRRPRPLGFETIAIEVHVEADAPRDVLRSLVDHAVLRSPVANTLHDPVHIDVALVTE